MDKKPRRQPAPPPQLPEPDPEAMAEAAAKFLRKSKPPGAWKPGREIRQTESEGDST